MTIDDAAVTAASSPLLVLGASGLVGSYVAMTSPMQTVRAAYRNVGSDMVAIDIRDRGEVRSLFTRWRPSVVVHAAADPNVEACERDPAGTRLVNVGGLQNVVAAASEVGSRVVYFSSDYVFDGLSGRPYTEEDPTSPINEYGRQKVEAESIVLERPEGLVCRISGVFGWEHGRADCRNFVCQVVSRLERGERVRAAGDQALCPTYALDAAAAVHDLIAGEARGVMHVVGPDALSRYEFARLVAEIFGLPDRVDAVSSAELALAATRPPFSALATKRLAASGVRVPRSCREALTHMASERPGR